MNWWEDFKLKCETGSVLELVVDKKVLPCFLFFQITNRIQGSLHISELNWNFGLCTEDFRKIQEGDTLKAYVIDFNEQYKKVSLGRKLLPEVERPSEARKWKELELNQEVDATVFEEFQRKVIVRLPTGLFATYPNMAGKTYPPGGALKVVPVRKVSEGDMIETIPADQTPPAEQISKVLEAVATDSTPNEFNTAEHALSSYEHLAASLYWNYLSADDQELLKDLFSRTSNLFSKAEKGEEPIHFEFEFDFRYNAYQEFIGTIGPILFACDAAAGESELLLELSKQTFWYTQYDVSKQVEGTVERIVERTFSLFNDALSIKGIISEEGALKIRSVKAKVKNEWLREKQDALKRNDVFFISRPMIFSRYGPLHTFNKQFINRIADKQEAFRLFEIARTKSLEQLQSQGKEFKIFSSYLESQVDREVKLSNETELILTDCQIDPDVQTEGLTFSGLSKDARKLLVDDKVNIAVRAEDERPKGIGRGTVTKITSSKVTIKSTVESVDMIRNGCVVRRKTSVRQHVVQLDILNRFFVNKLPLDTFYRVFHFKGEIDPPEEVSVEFENPVFREKENHQTRAVRKAIGNKNIVLIQGPPGTGKTTVITEIVRQLVQQNKKVLVTSQTHVAVDNVLERIIKDTGITIARVGSPDSTSELAAAYLFDEARKRFAQKIIQLVDLKIEWLSNSAYQREGDTDQSFHSLWSDFDDFRAKVKLLTAEEIAQAVTSLKNWKEVLSTTPKLLTSIFLRNIDVLFGTCIGIATSRDISESDLVFDTVILDEAGKANLSETLTAISRARRIVLVGDHKQLPPYLDQEKVNYFQAYSKVTPQMNIEDIKKALGGSFFEYLQKDGVLPSENKVLLAVQHRMHPDIGNFISRSFYDSELKNGPETVTNTIPLPPPFDKQIIFIDTSPDKGRYETVKDASYVNEVEAKFIVEQIIPELTANRIDLKSCAIVSPYRKQCERIRELFSQRSEQNADRLEVATLDSFQGREHDIIIFSFTRSSLDKTVGFLDDARRLNVALSRAKKKLILIGDAVTLSSKRAHFDPYYATLFRKLWEHAGKYGHAYKINELDAKRLQVNINVGDVLDGTVKRIEPYFVIVDLGSTHGSIHISELSWSFVRDPYQVLSKKQAIKVLVIDKNAKGIQLSLKRLSANRGKNMMGSFNKNHTPRPRNENSQPHRGDQQEMNGKITKIVSLTSMSIKVYLDLENGMEGTLHTLSGNKLLSTGRMIRVIVERVDPHTKKATCKLKQ